MSKNKRNSGFINPGVRNKGEIDLESDQVVIIKQGINITWNWVVNVQANDLIEKGKNPIDDRNKGK